MQTRLVERPELVTQLLETDDEQCMAGMDAAFIDAELIDWLMQLGLDSDQAREALNGSNRNTLNRHSRFHREGSGNTPSAAATIFKKASRLEKAAGRFPLMQFVAGFLLAMHDQSRRRQET